MMLVLGIRYLNGWAMATHPADRRRPEWPPHPDRVFMAMAAACFETEGGTDERKALEWLEGLGPPNVHAAHHVDRTPVTTFVPVNDSKRPIKQKRPLMTSGSLRIGRDRQPRQFPVAIPEDDTVFLAWKDVELTNVRRGILARLCAKVTSVGHSASLVQVWVADKTFCDGEDGIPQSTLKRMTLVPVIGSSARFRFRIFGPGRLADLEDRFNKQGLQQWHQLNQEIATQKGQRKKEAQRVRKERFGDTPPRSLRPTVGLWQGYAIDRPPEPLPQIARGNFASDLIVLRQTAGRTFGLESTLQLTRALRNVVMSASPIQPPPEWISGHQRDRSKSDRNAGHIAFLPLPHVGHEHADGHLLGLALAIPNDISTHELSECLHPLLFDDCGWPKSITLTLGPLGACVLELAEQHDVRTTLRPETWTGVDRPSHRWGTVTPIALDRHAKGNDPWIEVENIIGDGCRRIGLPRPSSVIPVPVSVFIGAPSGRDMPRIVRKGDGGRVQHVHAIVTFPEPVSGPVLIGAGRYRGYGVCRPMHWELD